ncbi:MAG: hypothetical protein LBH07_02220, partial [Treponema sp.]|nr:hypothetical protein [Treponema sp.]
NTAAVNRHEAVLKYITDRKNVTRAEVEAFYRNGIRALISDIVDEEFNKIGFLLRINPQTSYNCVLTRYANNQCILSYESYFGTDTYSRKELPPTLLEALPSAMSRSRDFPQAAIDIVKAQAALIPAVVYEKNNNTMLSSVKSVLTDFNISPTRNNYENLVKSYNVFRMMLGEREFEYMYLSMRNTLSSLHPGLADRVMRDAR